MPPTRARNGSRARSPTSRARLTSFSSPATSRCAASRRRRRCSRLRAAGLPAVVHCGVRIVLLHYAPVVDTLEGEPPGIRTFLGCDRLATPIAENGADLVLHGHAHAGAFDGQIGAIPVYNVAVHVTGRNFWIFELDAAGVRRGGEVVEVREPPQ